MGLDVGAIVGCFVGGTVGCMEGGGVGNFEGDEVGEVGRLRGDTITGMGEGAALQGTE